MTDDDPKESRIKKVGKSTLAGGAAGGAAGLAKSGSLEGGVLGALAGSAGALAKGITTEGWGFIQQTFSRGVQREISDFEEQIDERVEKLVEEHGEPARLDAANVIVGWAESRRSCADAKKARLLMAALLHSLEPSAYEEGLALTILQILKGLEYMDVRVLRAVTDLSVTKSVGPIRAAHPELVFANGHMVTGGPDSLQQWHVSRLEDAGLVVVKVGRVHPTELGRKALEFVKGGMPGY